MSRIVVVGSLNMDVVAVAPRIPVAGETIIGNKYFTEPGGKGANQAYASAKLGGKVAMLGRIGDDDFGRRMRDNVGSAGCDVSGLKSVPGPSGVALIFVSSSGQNSIIVVPGANGALTAADVEAEAAALDGAGIVLLQLENPVEAVLAAARLSKQRGARVILDPAPAPADPLPPQLLATVDIVTPNETEAAILAGLPPGRLNPEEAAQLAAKLQSMGAHTVIMKLGDQGCLLVEPGGSTYIPAPKVKAVDTTAAGDTYNAALAVGLSEGMALVDACRFAVYASALSVTRLGTQLAVPTRAEVDAFANQRGKSDRSPTQA
jgi:ribokinase